MFHIFLMVPGARVSLIMGESSLRGQVLLGRNYSVFPGRNVYKASSSCKSRCANKHLLSSTLKDTGVVKQG